ncbi:endonuclease domain-containing protein [Labrys sp. ZIDIC5]|uniref:endonuclease domain-containing protein n=1 Tax=Labrys sedimenti TaxID=3106036 RepID=UPI002ACAB82D|nr:endonuclease domain-containing protein [Labrys sp. ZIDIC5]MDZ5451571.1 endonuclease domain-containing protein [Labrys sp. ZIDIC5]
MSIAATRELRKRLTPQEVKLWQRLRAMRPQGFHIRRQVPIGRYVADFACLRRRLVVEVDGNQHAMPEGLARDGIRDAFLAERRFKVLRFSNHDVDHALASVIDTIFEALRSRWEEEEG